MFLDPNRTPYDIEFRLVDIPVRIHPMFWLVALILGWGAMREGIQFVAIWRACSSRCWSMNWAMF